MFVKNCRRQVYTLESCTCKQFFGICYTQQIHSNIRYSVTEMVSGLFFLCILRTSQFSSSLIPLTIPFCTPKGTLSCILLWRMSSVCLSGVSKVLSTHLLQIFSPRYIILGIMDGHDPYMIPIDFGVSRFKVKVTVTWSIKSLSTQSL